ncbi:hypothetical protein SLEP1_g47213 [Rubroshorea leprosula]|uniref:Uncharacterized protein n=1 Tax=Rubroshorea leprosula TaxID=152421 RepID=A0AAV5LQN0_9ROSI|nr:hypothetical protein SLEP1_g47213 [Rubroshorea leprosula]
MPQLRGQALRGALDGRVDPEERQYAGSNSSAHNSNGSGSPGEGHDHADSYASEDFVLGIRFTISVSLNAITAASSGVILAIHGAITSTITHVAVTIVAIASAIVCGCLWRISVSLKNELATG